MSRVSAYYPNTRNDKALCKAIARGLIDADIKNDAELAEKLLINRGSYYRYRKDNYNSMKLAAFKRMVKILKFTPEELMAIFGVEPS